VDAFTRLVSGRSTPLLTAGALVGAVALVAAVSASAGGNGGPEVASGSESAAAMPAAAIALTTTTTLPATTTTAPKTTIESSLHEGMYGAEIERLQQRLTDLGFQPGPVDGYFGDLTVGAVWAYQTLVDGVPFNARDGVVTPEMWQALQDPLPITARRPDAGKHTEIYLPEQALIVYDGATPLFISHISSGDIGEEGPGGDDINDGAEWCQEVTIDPGEYGNETGTEPLKKGVCGNAWTPGGVYEFYRKVEGVRESRLGGLLNPVYFNNGIAVHGAYQVPDYPASHGCIRIPNLISKTFQDLVQIGEQVFVFDGVEPPEVYGDQSGWWDWADPDYTTTTTAPPSTTAPPTTAAPTTTQPPAPVTTAAPATTRPPAPPTTRPPATTQPPPPPPPPPPPTTATTMPPPPPTVPAITPAP